MYETQTENNPEGNAAVYPTCGKRNEKEMRVLVRESFNCAVLNSACSSTVCGVDWLDSYLESLPDNKTLTTKQW